MSADAALAEAYRATTYRVHAPGGAIDLRVGQASPALDGLLIEQGAACWAIVTAWNPQSRPQCESENTAAQAALERQLAQAGYRCLPAENIADDGLWPAEPGCFIFGMTRDAAVACGKAFAQRAVLVSGVSGVPELAWCTAEVMGTPRREV